MGPLDVLWEDPYGLAVNKPAGLLTQPARSGDDQPTLEGSIRLHLRPDDPASVYLGTVHRLDRPVSGVILWAKTPKAAHRWAEQFAGRLARKEYWAIVELGANGIPQTGEVWDDWLLGPDRSGQAQVVPPGTPGAVQAITRVEVGDPEPVSPSGDRLLWLKLRPETGRTHQLRAQAASRGWPIVGDATYGSTTPFDRGIALHARTLAVEHPIRRSPMTLHAPPPPSWSGWRVLGA